MNDLIYKILTSSDISKLELEAKSIISKKEENDNKEHELKQEYLNSIHQNQLDYEYEVEEYMKKYNETKNLLDKVNIKPPIKNYPEIYTYHKPTFQFKEDNNIEIQKLTGKYVDFAKNYYIINPCNVTGRIAKDLTKEIFEAYPESDIYTNKTKRKLGDIFIFGNIINTVIQKSPLKPKEPDDTEEIRLEAYKTCLDKIGKKLKDVSIVFKYISKKHYELIQKFANDNTTLKIFIA
jgi:hypothetical protein